MIEQGAELIDIAETTRPGSEPVDEAEELKRVVRSFKSFEQSDFSSVSIQLKPLPKLRLKLEQILSMTSPDSKLTQKMKQVAINTQAGCMLMHMRGTPQTMQQFLDYEDIVQDIISYFEEIIRDLVSSGIDRKCLMIDPGIGFSKNVEQNLTLIRQLADFEKLKLPILLGTS